MKSFFIAGTILLTSFFATAKSELSVKEARIFAPLKGSPATAGYAVFSNASEKDVKLVVKEASPFKAVEMHQTLERDGKMAMEKVDSWTVPAKGSFELKPGGHHMMLFDPSKAVKEGDFIKVAIEENGQTQVFKFKVIPRGENSEHHHHH